MKVLVLLLLLFSPASIESSQSPPDGWRYPNKSDYRGNWKRYRKELPVPFHIRADFNGDEIIDDAWILIPVRGKGHGLFVFLGQSSGSPKATQLYHTKAVAPQAMYLSLAESQSFETACGKGCWDCAPDQPTPACLVRSAIQYAWYGNAISIFHWSTERNGFIQSGWMAET